jgi:GNAT superfamily N-acetyltransferase
VSVTIRDAGPDDARSLSGLLGQLGYPTSEAAVPPRLAALAAARDRVFVAEQGGRVVGLAHLHVSPSVELDGPVAKLGALVVDDAKRGFGVGRDLVAAVEREARDRGCVALFLTTSERRADAHAFYEGNGFAHTGRRYAKRLT